MGGLMEVLLAFMDKGGDVLWLIAVLLFVMWALIFERVWYLQFGWKKDVAEVIARWESRSERKSWEAHQIRAMLISRTRMQINKFLPLIKTLVALSEASILSSSTTSLWSPRYALALDGLRPTVQVKRSECAAEEPSASCSAWNMSSSDESSPMHST